MPGFKRFNDKKDQFSLFTYNISKLNKSKKVSFVYALKGRKEEKGLVKHYKGEFLAPACFMVPGKHEKEMLDIFKMWNVKFKKKRIKILD